jgi:protein phosphatase
MISSQQTSQQIIYCSNPDCQQPVNSVGDSICANCSTPLVYRYLWATGTDAAKLPTGTKVVDRYEVVAEQIWLDTQPGMLPTILSELPDTVIAYLKLYQYQLHLPQAYGFASTSIENDHQILLLENAPIDEQGNLFPTMADVWEYATAVRQIYWLWQILQLWTPLSELGVAHSLLLPDNLRIQGWCVRLLELHSSTIQPSLEDLGQSWQSWLRRAEKSISPKLADIIEQMCQSPADLTAISHQLNTLLLSAAAELPLTLNIAVATETGPIMQHNEDSCYPSNAFELEEYLHTRLSIVCDGIGGHEGGEVASQLAVQSLKLQIRALLVEVATQQEIVPPDVLQQQLEACLRVVNNLIWSRNNEQQRQGRERMATTLVMALQIPQCLTTNAGWQSENAHEVYIAHIGDSRAYWITPHYCQLLTIDDDMAMREVRLSKSLYRQAAHKPDAKALTQALGTKEGEFLRFSIQRLILEEDGILLLCSDGLSDSNWIEQSWQDYVMPILTGELAVEDAANDWVKRANYRNGQDNTSVILTVCRISSQPLVLVQPETVAIETTLEEDLAIVPSAPETPETTELVESESTEAELVASSQALLDLALDNIEEATAVPATPPNRGKPLILFGGLLALLLGTTSIGLFAWRSLSPQSFGQICRQLPQNLQQLCPPGNTPFPSTDSR